MALSIKTDEADRLARELAKLTGETLTRSVTEALRERLDRERATSRRDEDLPDRIRRFAEQVRPDFDTRPVSRAEWDWASGEEA